MGLDFETLTLPQQTNDRPDFFRFLVESDYLGA
jgi:hypothetical protein